MANADKTLQDKDYVNIYPITRERNVYDENNVNLKEKFKNVVFNDNEVFKFSQELYDESKNLFNSKKLIQGSTLEAISTRVNSFIKKVTAGETFVCSLYNSNLRYTFGFCKENRQIANNVIKETGWKTASGATLTSTEDGYLFITISTNPDGTSIKPSDVGENDIQLESGNIVTEFHPYNPNRHITNSEAEFLKDEHEASYNLWNNEEKGGIDESTGADIYNANRWRNKGYIEVKSNTQYTLSAVVSSSIWFVVYFYTNTKTFISSDAKNGTSNTITTPDNCAYIRCVVGDTASISSSNRQLTKSDKVLPYQPYNSASHITNAQADLLKSEWEKSINLYPTLNLTNGSQWGNNGSSYTDSNGWIDSTYYEIEPNTTYYTLVNQNVVLYDQNKTYISSLWYVSANGFTTPSNAKYYRIGGNLTSSPQSSCMLTKGIKPSEYHPYHGEIVRKGDIEPVTLWKNENINIAFLPDDNVNTQDYSSYEDFIFRFKAYTQAHYATQEIIFKKIQNSQEMNIIATINRKVLTRQIKFNSNNTSLNILDGYAGDAIDNSAIIPVALLAKPKI